MRKQTYRDLDEVARTVRTNEQRLVHRDRSSEHGATDHYPHAPDFVNAVDGEVNHGQIRLSDLRSKGGGEGNAKKGREFARLSVCVGSIFFSPAFIRWSRKCNNAKIDVAHSAE